jgi:uncharacterized protein (DUF2236 family)
MEDKHDAETPVVERDKPTPNGIFNEKLPGTSVDDELLERLETTENIQKVVREGLLISAGAAAILLQVAMPGVGLGVENHSNFAYRPLHRLETTMTFVYCMAFGTRQEKKAVIEMVHRAHAPVQGANYSADDPNLQMWVAATLYASAIYLYEEVCGKLERHESDVIYREYSVLAISLRVPPEMWPKNRASFWEYWDSRVAGLEITDPAKRIAQDLLYNKNLPIYFRLFMPTVRLVTAELLPTRVREGYGLKSTKLRRAAYKSLMAMTKATYPALPKSIRCYPLRFYMKKMREKTKNMV